MAAVSRAQMQDHWRASLTLVLSFTQVAAAGLPRFGIGTDIGARSDAAATFVTPPGWTFAIWGLLYTGCIAYGVYQFLPSKRADPLCRTIGWATAAAFWFNTAWAIEVTTGGITILSAAIIIALLVSLICAIALLGRTRLTSTTDRYLVAAPISALAAWITAATIVNIASSLNAAGVTGGDQVVELASAAVAVTVLAVVTTLALTRGNPWYAAVSCWALAGVAVGHERRPDVPLLIAVCAAGAAIILATALIQLRKPGALASWFSFASAPNVPAPR